MLFGEFFEAISHALALQNTQRYYITAILIPRWADGGFCQKRFTNRRSPQCHVEHFVCLSWFSLPSDRNNQLSVSCPQSATHLVEQTSGTVARAQAYHSPYNLHKARSDLMSQAAIAVPSAQPILSMLRLDRPERRAAPTSSRHGFLALSGLPVGLCSTVSTWGRAVLEMARAVVVTREVG